MLVATIHFLTPSGAFWNILACKSDGNCEYIGNTASGGDSSISSRRSVKTNTTNLTRSYRALFNCLSKVIAELLWFCFTFGFVLLYDFFYKLAPPSRFDYQPLFGKMSPLKTGLERAAEIEPGHLFNQSDAKPKPTFGASNVYFLWVFIGSLCCLRLLWLAIAIALVLV